MHWIHNLETPEEDKMHAKQIEPATENKLSKRE